VKGAYFWSCIRRKQRRKLFPAPVAPRTGAPPDETGAIDVMQFDCNAHAGITEWRKVADMASMCYIRMAPHHEPVLHGHLLASVPNGYILESFANPDRDPFWFEIYDRKHRIEKSILYLDDTPGQGIEFREAAIKQYGTKIL
jgi:L-alanine-DL-glutamate epimerase-like enolase superfamily enzyme